MRKAIYLCDIFPLEPETTVKSWERGFPGGSVVKNPPAKQETQVWSLGWEDPQKEMATHIRVFAWKIPWIEKPGGLQPMGSQKSQTQLSD